MKKLLVCFFLFAGSFCAVAQTDAVPVRITSLEAGITNQHANFTWRTACSLDFAIFELQRSSNGYDFTSIHSFTADKSRCAQPFYFTDSSASTLSGRVYYRLKAGDIDGRFSNSKTVSILSAGKGLEINSLIPSVITSNAVLSISSSATDNAELIIISHNGMIMQRKTIRLNKGVTSESLDLSSLPQGTYSLVLQKQDDNERKIVRFVKM